MWLVAGLGLMGMLVGMLAGMSSSVIVQPLIALLFAFVGGSVFTILSKLSNEDRTLAGKMLTALCACCLAGVLSGMLIVRHQYLVPAELRRDVAKACASSSPPPECMLRSSDPGEAAIIDEKLNAGKINSDKAYEELKALYKQDHPENGQ
jgi:hypothetical protein